MWCTPSRVHSSGISPSDDSTLFWHSKWLISPPNYSYIEPFRFLHHTRQPIMMFLSTIWGENRVISYRKSIETEPFTSCALAISKSKISHFIYRSRSMIFLWPENDWSVKARNTSWRSLNPLDDLVSHNSLLWNTVYHKPNTVQAQVSCCAWASRPP